MKIIYEGSVPHEKDWKRGFACKGCSAELEIEASDLRTFHYFGTHFRHDYLGVKCPLCGKIKDFKKDEIPEPIFVKYWNDEDSEFDGYDNSIYLK